MGGMILKLIQIFEYFVWLVNLEKINRSVLIYTYPSFLYHSAVFLKPSSIPTFGR